MSRKVLGWLALPLVLAISWLQFSNWSQMHEDNLHILMDATTSVLHGTPHWRAYQNRVLSPVLVQGLTWLTGQSLAFFVQLMLLVLNGALYVLVLRRTAQPLLALLGVAACAMLWVLEQHYWSYSWDFTEAACWLTLAALAVSARGPVPVLLTIVVSAFNRESALFMTLYPLCMGVCLYRQDPAASRRWLLSGGLAVVLTVLIVEGLRKLLFDYSSLTGVGADLDHATFENHINLMRNLTVLKAMVKQPSALLFIFVFYAVAWFHVIWTAWQRRSFQVASLAFAAAMCMASLLVFGLLNELRLYQPFNWCLIFLLLVSGAARVSSGPAPAEALPVRGE